MPYPLGHERKTKNAEVKSQNAELKILHSAFKLLHSKNLCPERFERPTF